MIIFMELLKKVQGLRSVSGTAAHTGWSRQREHDHGDATCGQLLPDANGHLGCTRADVPGTSWVFFSSVTNSARGAHWRLTCSDWIRRTAVSVRLKLRDSCTILAIQTQWGADTC